MQTWDMIPKAIESRMILLILDAIGLTGLFSVNLLGNALAYTEDDPAVKYQCFEQNEDGSYNKTAEGDLIPCPIDHGDNAWMMTSAALVLMMTPAGLAFFYGGLTRQKNAVNTLHMVFITTAIVAVQWALFGYSLAFGPDAGGYGFIGTLDWAGLNNVLHDVPSNAYGGIGPNTLCSEDICGTTTIPHQTYMVFQMMFAIITPALIVASLAERMKYSAFVIFVVLWATFVYDFAAHWTWEITAEGNYGANPDYCGFGWTGCLGSLDFAGGTVIHITSGWSGFNAGSAAAAATNATSAFVATQIATAMAVVTWALISWAHTGRPSTVGAASGAVAGLVAITPASGFVSPMSALIIGIVASVVCYAALVFKNKRKWDDALDTWAVHGIGGLAGALLTGTLAEKRFTPWGDDGLAFGNPAQLYENAVGAFAALAWAMGITALIIKIMDLVWPGGIRVTPKEEEVGLDLVQHGERAYVTG